MADPDAWGLSWGGAGVNQGIWGVSWALNPGAQAPTDPAYGPPFVTLHSPLTVALTLDSPITTVITLYSDIDERS